MSLLCIAAGNGEPAAGNQITQDVKKHAQDVEKHEAKVNRYEGLYVFSDCEPLRDYEYLGTVKVAITWSSHYHEVRNVLVKKARKEYGDKAEAIILNLTKGGTERADVIKFKD